MTIYGIGGVGKSTLVATFMMRLVDEADPTQRYAWAYLDMDRPTLRSYRPHVILEEILRQVAAQHPAGRRGLEGRREAIAHKSVGEGLETAFDSSDLFYETIGDLSFSVSSWTPHPLVVVLDTFEELEHTEPELRIEIYDMLDRLSGELPLKLIVSGRAPAEPFSSGSVPEDRLLEIREFEGPQALTLLRHFLAQYPEPIRIGDDLGTEIVRTVGGNPLTLKLAASVLAAEGPEGLDEAMSRAEVLDQVRREFIRGFLYQRIIEHLQSSKPGQTETLQAVARASLPLRRFTPDLIRAVILPAIGVEHPDPAWLYEDLARTVAFVRREGNESWLRVDVRVPALRALRYLDQPLVDRVHQLAAGFYSDRLDQPDALVELAFHRLELGESIADLDLDPADLTSLRDWASQPEALTRPSSPRADDEETVLRLERMYQARQATVLADQSLARGEVAAARAAFDDLDPAVFEDLSKFDVRLLMDLAWLDSRIHEAQDDLESSLDSAERALEAAARVGDRTRYAAMAIWTASVQERAGEEQAALETLDRANESTLLAGDPRLRLEILLNRIATMERLGVVDEERRWRLELWARALLNALPPGAVDSDTALLRLLAATLGRDEPTRLKAALMGVGLGSDDNPEQLRALAAAMARWDASGTDPGRLARSISVKLDGSLPPEDAWMAALSGMGPESGYTLASLWEIEEPPGEVREAIRALYVYWGMKRARVGSGEERPHFLDETPLDFGREEVREFERIVLDGYGRPESLARLADLAGLDPASLNLTGRTQTMVRNFLIDASRQGRLRDVSAAMAADTSLGTLTPRLQALTDETGESFSA